MSFSIEFRATPGGKETDAASSPEGAPSPGRQAATVVRP